MTTILTPADLAQLRASNPAVSAFVDASAGSGKTKLLTDRLLRLMMAGADPTKILCLTFTKAAAAEMSLRLRSSLASWVTAPEATLIAELHRLEIKATPENLNAARSLFGTVLDLPGGINIGTIHSFCQSMLRRFPLEAQVSPHFQIADDSVAAQRRRTAKDVVLAGDDFASAVAVLAAEQNDAQFTKAIGVLLEDPETFLLGIREYGLEGLIARQREALGVGHVSVDQLWRVALKPGDEAALRSALEIISERGSPSARGIVAPGLDWLGRDEAGRRSAFQSWSEVFLTKEGSPRADSKLANKELQKDYPNVLDAIHLEQVRLIDLVSLFQAASFAAASEALVQLVAPILAAEEKSKASSGTLDYSDLILKTAGLLIDPGAAWVLFKMDGGIDHILVDEVQDVSPAQWRIIWSLLGDFFSGEGARAGRRTIFAVGDMKQSIFSFQGADLDSFVHFHDRLRDMVGQADQKWVDGELNTSFRSAAGVLDVVDAVFEDPLARRGVAFDETVIRHRVSRVGQSGSVRLWPLMPAFEKVAVPDWAAADRYTINATPRQRLAYGVADWIKRNIGYFELESRSRTLKAGDILVLVQGRNDFGEALVRALKQAGIPVAGLDRIALADSRAVADLCAFAEAVMLPQNDLAVGTFLCSPLGGLSDESFMELALGRPATLSGALFARRSERPDWQAAHTLYVRMQAMVDFVSPFQFFTSLLGVHGGRQALARRLGPDALEPIDEFLAAALRFAQQQTPTLRGFLNSIETSKADIKRDTDAAADAVRIMTVHGAKGLQAPVVIMPDTIRKPGVDDVIFWLPGSDHGPLVPVLAPRGGKDLPVIAAEISKTFDKEHEEHNRLLYVAMTRAEDHLIVCAPATVDDEVPDESWYSSVRRGLQRLPGAVTAEYGPPHLPWVGDTITYRSEQEATPDKRIEQVIRDAMSPIPAWMGRSPEFTPVPPSTDLPGVARIIPSRIADDLPANIRAGRPAFGKAVGRSAALQRGTVLHTLLQHLPAAPADSVYEIALQYVVDNGFTEQDAEDLVDEAMKVWAHPEIAPVFAAGARAEVPIVGIIDNAEVTGVIDRLNVTATDVIFVDFKSDRRPPTTLEDVPGPYAKQVGAYASVLALAYPGRRIVGHLVWTASGEVMRVADLANAG